MSALRASSEGATVPPAASCRGLRLCRRSAPGGRSARSARTRLAPGSLLPGAGVCTHLWSLYTCGIERAGVGCPRLHLGLGNVRPPRGRCLGLCPRRLRHRLKCGRGTLGSGAVLWFGVRCRLAQGCRGQLDDSPQSLGVGPEGAAQEQPNVERWVIRARPPEATLCSRLGDEDRRDVCKLQPSPARRGPS